MRTSLCVAALALVGSNAAYAQMVLTEAEALARLSADSPRVRTLRAEIDVAEADAAAASRFPNPRLTLSREAVAGIAEDFWLVSQPLPVTGRRNLEAHAAEALVRATRFRVSDLERRARAELRLAFVSLRERQIREGQLAATVRDFRELADVLAKREEAGDAAGFDRLRAEREVLDVEADLAAAAAARVQAQAEVAAFFSPPVDPLAITVVTEVGAPRALPAGDELVTRAEARGDLLALSQQLEASRLTGRAAARRNVPEPEIVAGMKRSTVAGGDRGSVVSVLIAVPLFDRSRPEQARARARERQVGAELELRGAQVRAEVTGLRDIVAERRASADAYRTAAVGRSDQLRRIARVSYDAGERGILELLDAYRSAAAARLRLAELDRDVARAEIELEFASGWESLR
jgi:cobalt-zinc-cadmium efflux system outer membrane protein